MMRMLPGRLLDGHVKDRFAANRSYMASLRRENLLQNHYFEAGLWGPPTRLPDDAHGGLESPNSLVRGHFLGHWLSAAAYVWQRTGDAELKGRADWIVSELARCQVENGGEWVASIPEKYLERIARGRSTWAAQYVVEKTLMGLHDMYAVGGNDEALEVLRRAAGWFSRWTSAFDRVEMDGVLDYETGAMLELWANLYAITGEAAHADLIERYDRRGLFDGLLAGEDMLSNRHANTTIPQVIGAARAWEVTGHDRFRRIVERFWESAVTLRGHFATGGQTSGEEWTPPGRLAARLGPSNQEHCTVYNMRRLADHLFRWTGDVAFADYRERNLVNGTLAQQNAATGMVTYYLPLRPGSTKTWSDPTESFWCCVGTLLQAWATVGDGLWYAEDDDVVLAGYVPSEVTTHVDGVATTLGVTSTDPAATPVAGRMHIDRPVPVRRPEADRWYVSVRADRPVPFALDLRLPWWLSDAPRVEVNGEPVTGGRKGWIRIEREWRDDTVLVDLPRAVTAEPLPDAPDVVAFCDGPTVLAGLCDRERTLVGDPHDLLVPDDERTLRRWNRTYRAAGQDEPLRFVPLHDVVDEPYSVYFPVRAGRG